MYPCITVHDVVVYFLFGLSTGDGKSNEQQQEESKRWWAAEIDAGPMKVCWKGVGGGIKHADQFRRSEAASKAAASS
jgi:hypothetical protein